MTGRDWKRVEAELEGLLPGGFEAGPRLAPDQPIEPADPPTADEDSILKHIADALQLDKPGQP